LRQTGIPTSRVLIEQFNR